jgi:hypothetical protein
MPIAAIRLCSVVGFAVVRQVVARRWVLSLLRLVQAGTGRTAERVRQCERGGTHWRKDWDCHIEAMMLCLATDLYKLFST